MKSSARRVAPVVIMASFLLGSATAAVAAPYPTPSGTRVVGGAIEQTWLRLGGSYGFLGWPRTDETRTLSGTGAFNHFDGGSIYWSPSTGPHVVVGAIREKWASVGWETSSLGFPTSDEYAIPGGARSDFQGGCITWTPSKGAVLGCSPQEPVHAKPWASGVYYGNSVESADDFGTWRGTPVSHLMAFPRQDDWALIESMTDVMRFKGTPYADNYKLIVSAKMVPCYPGSTDSIAKASTGVYDAHYVRAGQSLVAAGLGKVIIRPNWEFNSLWACGSTFPNGRNPGSVGTSAEFASAWRHYVNALRSVPGSNFRFTWNPISVDTAGDAWPGDAYVDYIGIDIYDTWWGHSDATAAERWASKVDGLVAFALFAAAHRKPMSFDEWGVWDGAFTEAGAGGDSPKFIQYMHDWMKTHNVAYDTYFNASGREQYGDHRLYISADRSKFPKAAARYKELF